MASEAQYERHFKKWGFSKNQKKEAWEDLSRIIEKRRLDGKDSEVYLNNKLVKTARRQLARYKSIQGLHEKILPSASDRGMSNSFLFAFKSFRFCLLSI